MALTCTSLKKKQNRFLKTEYCHKISSQCDDLPEIIINMSTTFLQKINLIRGDLSDHSTFPNAGGTTLKYSNAAWSKRDVWYPISTKPHANFFGLSVPHFSCNIGFFERAGIYNVFNQYLGRVYRMGQKHPQSNWIITVNHFLRSNYTNTNCFEICRSNC